MTGLITSTLRPSDAAIYGGARSAFSPAERLAQTVETVRTLVDLGVSTIYLLDNSEHLDLDQAERALVPARVVRCPPTAFANKGISEAHMVSHFCRTHAAQGPVLKVSGRYRVGQVPAVDWGRCDVAAVADDRHVVTQCYAVRDLEVMGRLMEGALREMYGYASRVVGLRSAWRVVRNSLFPGRDDYPYHDPTFSLEFGCRRAIRHHDLRLCPADFGVQGVFGGGASGGLAVAPRSS